MTELLRPGVLQKTSILVVGASPARGSGLGESFGSTALAACERLGSRVSSYTPTADVDEAAMDGAVSAAAEPDGLDMLVVDGAGLFASAGLRGCLELAWDATRAAVNRVFLSTAPGRSGGRVLYLAPPSRAGDHADGARAGLENLARTLSVEWARHQITLVTVALGDATTTGEAAALTAYLASPAGAYFSGCQLDLRRP